MQGSAVFGKCRRVHYHHVIFSFRDILEKINGVAAETFMLSCGKTVQDDVLVHEIHCTPGTVHGIHMRSTAAQGIYGKASGVAEKVQNIAAGCIFLNEMTVLSLVKEESSLLAVSPVHLELVPVFKDGLAVVIKAISSVCVSVHQVESGLERSRPGTLVIDGLEFVAIDFFQCIGVVRPCPLRPRAFLSSRALESIVFQKSGFSTSESKLRTRTAIEPI